MSQADEDGDNLFDRYDDDGDYYKDRDVVCSRCGTGGLSWVHTGVRWALTGARGLHTCATKPSADDFEVIA